MEKKDNRFKAIHVRFIPPVYCPLVSNIKEKINGKNVVYSCRDVTLFFDQERLEKLGHQNVIDFLSGLENRVSDIPEGVSTSDLKEYIKPRYMSSLSDLENWSYFLMNKRDDIVSEAKSRASHEKATAAQKRVSEFIEALLSKSKSD